MLGFGVLHGIIDGLTITGGSAAIALVAPKERLASAQGLMGGLQTLMGGIAAIAAGATYDAFGRTPTYLVTALVMLVLIAVGAWLAKSSLRLNGVVEAND
jgi:MFS family permease